MNIGVPFLWGDFTSFGSGKNAGFMIGTQGSYQCSPELGLTLSLDYGYNKLSARNYAHSYLLSKDGMTYYTPQVGATELYSNLYSKVSYVNVGLHFDVNLNHFFSSKPHWKWVLLLSPAVYAQHFAPSIYTKSNDSKFTDSSIDTQWSFGLGGGMTLRYRFNEQIDFQVQSILAWITNSEFDGISTKINARQNAIWTTTIGAVWKFGGVDKKEHLMYINR